ncbi:unnamed protein product [Brugia timori]|uniref:C2H2-type domain-containing protein n=1 Tax=Brugia timori TaxID=42155 RepID=A0A0R3RA75_9BILA|nr:unnamed protein product [Brugia timori]
MSRSVDDLGLQQPSIPTGRLDGVIGLIDIYNNSTAEVRYLLANECSIVLECRCCGNFFRDYLDYVTHKRFYCRMSCSTAASAFCTAALEFAEKALAGKHFLKRRNIGDNFETATKVKRKEHYSSKTEERQEHRLAQKPNHSL